LIELGRIKPLFVRDVGEEELEELAKSIEAVGGVVEPVVVRPSKEGDAYELICGYRRFLAHKRLGLSVIEAVVVECDDKEAYQLFLIENLQRVDLTDYEIAKRLGELRDRFNLTPTQIAQLLGKSVGWVGDHLRMLELEKDVAKVVSRPSFARAKDGQVMNKLTQRHAKVILAQAEPVREKLVEHVVEHLIKEGEPPSARALERRAEELRKELARPKVSVESIQEPRPTTAPTPVEEEEGEEEEEGVRVLYRKVVRGAEEINKAFEEFKQMLERGTISAHVESGKERPSIQPSTRAEPTGRIEVGIPERTAVSTERLAPVPSAEEVATTINDLLLKLSDVLERLRLSAATLIGRRVRAVFEHPYEEGEEDVVTGTLTRADRRAVYVEVALGGGSKAERMIRWYELKRIELA